MPKPFVWLGPEDIISAATKTYGTGSVLPDHASVNVWASEIHNWAKGRGWWENPDRPFLELCMLGVSEFAEAAEAYRDGQDLNAIYWVWDKYGNPKPDGPAIELTDVLIRVFDTMDYYGLDIADLLRIKHAYNLTRPYRHGGKRA